MLTVQDLITPKGQLEAFLFPKRTQALSQQELESRVAGWLTAAESAAAAVASGRRDEAVRVYVYWQAYQAVCLQMNRQPGSTQTDSGKSVVSFTDGQRKEFARLRDKYEAEFKDFLPVDEPERKRRSGAVKIRVRMS